MFPPAVADFLIIIQWTTLLLL